MDDYQRKNTWKLVFSFIALTVYLALVVIFIFASAFSMYSSTINYVFLGVVTLIFGIVYKWLQDDYDNSVDFQVVSAVTASSISLPLFMIPIGVINSIAEAFREISATDKLMYFNADLIIYAAIFLITFNVSQIIAIAKEKKPLKYAYYIVPVIIALGIYFVI